jgi:hypothetical protein
MEVVKGISADELTMYLMMLLNSSPMLLAAIVGAIVAMVMWQRAPRGALLLLIGCSIQFVITLINSWVYGWYLPHARLAEAESHSAIQVKIGIWGMCTGLIHVVVMVLLICAVFAGRPKPARSPPALP